jgi:hypothetical protein
MNNEQLHRDLGRLEGEVKALRATVDGMNTKLDAALAQLNRARGAGFIAGGVVSAVVAFATAWATK